jgi:hypothetical protein
VLAWVVGCGTDASPPAAPPKGAGTDQAGGSTSPTDKTATAKVESAPAPTQPKPRARLIINPKAVTFLPGYLGVQLIAIEHGKDDVTRKVTWSIEPAGIATVDSTGYLKPVAPGKARVCAEMDRERAFAEVKVEKSSGYRADFGEDIVPLLTRAGCNTGACHGRAEGQNGFHLSLFGYDPAGDYQALTRDAGGRRVSALDPTRSLLLLKATGRSPHGGGPRMTVGSPEYQALLAWVEAGAPERMGPSHGGLSRVTVEPAEVRLDEPGPQQLRVVARYADGSERDVTRLASYRVNDDSAATVDPQGHAVLLRRAETDLIVRYQSQVVSTRLATVINPGLALDFAKLPRRNFIDDELYKRLASLKVPPSPPASDAAFLRRASLDLTGQQPSPEQVRQFLADQDPDKRDKLVDRLLADRDFVRFWEIKVGDLLQITTARLGNGAYKYQSWITDRLTENAPWDATVRTLLTAVGDPIKGGGPANYALDGPDAKTQAEQTAQRFLGIRLRCAQCHDHPFDVWTQDDYYGLAACFAKVDRSGGMGMMERVVVKIDPTGSVEHLRTKKPAQPRLLDGTPVTVAADEDPRKALADWMTAPDNPYFARATANFVWAQFFGKGLVDPPDDMSRSNPPVHPELLDALARHFVEHKYDLRDLIRTIATSSAYAMTSATVPGNEHDTRLFSHHVPRPLTAHQMADALAQATDVPNPYPNRYRKTRAIEITEPTTASLILDTFGRCSRTVACSSVAAPSLSLRQSLLLIGGDVIDGKVAHLNGYLSALLDLSPAPEEVIENLYYRTVCRPPTAEELSHWTAELKQSASLREAAEDLFWALLNSREFAFNH